MFHSDRFSPSQDSSVGGGGDEEQKQQHANERDIVWEQ